MARKEHSDKNAARIKANSDAARKHVLKLNEEALVRDRVRAIARAKKTKATT